MRLSVSYSDTPARTFNLRLRKNSRDLRPYWKLAAVVYTQFVHKVFDQEGTPDKWPPLSPNTIRRRRRGSNRAGGLRIRILQDTRQLRQSATHPTASGYGYYDTTNHSMTIGTSLRYAKYHHTGTRNMPQRRFYQIDNPTLLRMADVMNRAALRDAIR